LLAGAAYLLTMIGAIAWGAIDTAFTCTCVFFSAVGTLATQHLIAIRQSRGNFGAVGILQVTTNVLRAVVVCAVAFACRKDDIYAPVLASSTLALVTSAVVLLWLSRRDLEICLPSWKHWSHATGLSHMMLTTAVVAMASRADQLTGKTLLSEMEFGYYSLAASLISGLTLFQTALFTVSLHGQAVRPAKEQAIRQSIVISLMGGGAIVVATLVGDFVIELLFGTKFVPAMTPFLILLLTLIIGTAGTPFESLYTATRPALVTELKLAQLIGVVAFAFILARFGATGVAAAVLLSRVLGWLWLGRRRICQ
jgi:O-antigen/teichoic acid export membrane protein